MWGILGLIHTRASYHCRRMLQRRNFRIPLAARLLILVLLFQRVKLTIGSLAQLSAEAAFNGKDRHPAGLGRWP